MVLSVKLERGLAYHTGKGQRDIGPGKIRDKDAVAEGELP